MEDHLRTVGAEGVVQTRDHAHIADYGDELQIGEAVLQFETDVVHRRFGVVEEDELLDAERGQLPAQLRTDRTGGTRHHDCLATEVGDDLVHRDLDLLAPQQVLDLDLADGLPLHLAVYHLVDRGGDQHLQPAIRAEVDQPLLLLAGLTGVGEEDGVDVLALLQVLDILLRLEVVDRQVGQHVVLQRLAVGQEADHLILLRVLQLGDERCPLVTGSVDEDPAAVEALLTAVLEQVVEDDHYDTHHDQGREGQQHVEHQRDADIRMPVLARNDGQQDGDADSLQEDGDAQPGQLTQRGVANDRLVGLEQQEGSQREDDGSTQPPADGAGRETVGAQKNVSQEQ